MDTIALNIFLPDVRGMTPLGKQCAFDEGGILVAQSQIIANGELLNANCFDTDPINWEDLVESTKFDGDYALAICGCGWEMCRPETPYEIRHANGVVHCFIEWCKHREGSRTYCWSLSDYVTSVCSLFPMARSVLKTRPPTPDELTDGNFEQGDLATNIGHADFTLRLFEKCQRRFLELWPEQENGIPIIGC